MELEYTIETEDLIFHITVEADSETYSNDGISFECPIEGEFDFSCEGVFDHDGEELEYNVHTHGSEIEKWIKENWSRIDHLFK